MLLTTPTIDSSILKESASTTADRTLMEQSSTILFVDSDKNQLQSLQRSLRSYQDQWDLHYAEDTDSALAVMQKEPVDILVCETQLNSGKGSDLLEQAQALNPLATRLLFSGQTLRDPAQEMVQHAHQFIAKPCAKETLVSILERIIALRNMLNNQAMQEMINSLGSLPSLPDIYYRLIELLRSESATVHDIGLLVEQDLALSTKVLQMVNSAFFGLSRHISSPVHAVSLLGIETISSLALTAGIFTILKPSQLKSFNLEALWQHSLSVAGLTKALCAEAGLTKQESELPVMASLLHDLGKLVLITADAEEYQRILTQAKQQDLPLHLVEEESLWVDHAVVGAYLMGLWGLPIDAVEAVALHHKPEMQRVEQRHSLVVYAANLLIHNQIDSAHYATDDLEALLGSDQFESWMKITREYLDGEAA